MPPRAVRWTPAPNPPTGPRPYYPTGIWLYNGCEDNPGDYFDDGLQLESSFYHFNLPSAVKYGNMSVSVVGFTINPPSRISSGFERTDGNFDGIAFATVNSGDPDGAPYRLGSVPVAGHTKPVNVAISVDDFYNPGFVDSSDFDLKSVSLTVQYYTLG